MGSWNPLKSEEEWIYAPVFTYDFQGFKLYPDPCLTGSWFPRPFRTSVKSDISIVTPRLWLFHCVDDVGAIVGTTSDSKKPASGPVDCCVHREEHKPPGLVETVNVM